MGSPRREREEGTSAIELVLYMPLLLVAILLTVQFALVYLGNEVVSATAREASRVSRVTGDTGQGIAKGYYYADQLAGNVLENVSVQVTLVGEDQVRTVVTGKAPHVLPFLPSPTVHEEVVGPIEEFKQDQG